MARSLYLVLIALLLFFGCLKKQGWKVESPQWPRYRVEGWIKDSLSGKPIENAIVSLEPVLFIFPDSMDVDSFMTDPDGYFLFRSVPAMSAVLKVFKEGYNSYSKNLVIQRDRSLEIFLVPGG